MKKVMIVSDGEYGSIEHIFDISTPELEAKSWLKLFSALEKDGHFLEIKSFETIKKFNEKDLFSVLDNISSPLSKNKDLREWLVGIVNQVERELENMECNQEIDKQAKKYYTKAKAGDWKAAQKLIKYLLEDNGLEIHREVVE